MSDFRITPRNIDKVAAFLRSVPPGVKNVVQEAVAKYFVGNERHGLKHEPSWKFVSRAKAYGKVSDAPAGYFSMKQFRFVAAITDGFTKIPYTRTHELQNSWQAKRAGSEWIIVGSPGWVMGHNQAAQPRLVGWRSYVVVIRENMNGALRAGVAAINQWLRQKGK